jgi:hypothetical protein
MSPRPANDWHPTAICHTQVFNWHPAAVVIHPSLANRKSVATNYRAWLKRAQEVNSQPDRHRRHAGQETFGCGVEEDVESACVIIGSPLAYANPKSQNQVLPEVKIHVGDLVPNVNRASQRKFNHPIVDPQHDQSSATHHRVILRRNEDYKASRHPSTFSFLAPVFSSPR